VFYGAFLQVVEHLIAGDGPLAGNLHSIFEIRHIEIAHATGKYLALVAKPLESGKRVFQRMRAPPGQEKAIQPVGLEALE
jgi:hypothetical protein